MQERFAVRYVVDWGGDSRQRVYPSFTRAEDFANSITMDGTTALPHAVAILRQTRRHDLDLWQGDQSFAPIEVKRDQHSKQI